MLFRSGGRAWKLGSGFFISQSGTMITNYHVIAGASEIHIKLGDTVYDDCFISAYDELLDIAVIQVNAYGVPYLELTNVSPKVGDVVYAVGSSLGLTGTFSSGIVSYANRVIDDVSFIQTTAPISSGNSGGPLINEYGEVIGVNTYSYSAGQNINLAVPAKDARDLSMINSKSFLLDEWFLMTSEYFLPGESVKDIGDGASGLVWFCGNGTTYKCILRDSMQLMVTRAYSSEQYVLIALKAEDYNKLLQLDYSIIAVKNTEDMAYYDEISPRGLTKDTVRDDDGSGWLVMMFQIPQTSLDRNFNYFGLYIEGSRTPVEYEYYSWIMYPDEMVDSEFFG